LDRIEDFADPEERIENEIVTVCSFFPILPYLMLNQQIEMNIPLEKPKPKLRLIVRPVKPANVEESSEENPEAEIERGPEKASRAKILSQEAYDQILLFKTKYVAYSLLVDIPYILLLNCLSPKNFSKEERKSISKVSRTFDMEDDETGGDWPKGKVLHKIFFTKNKLRKGIHHPCRKKFVLMN
jgi:hypothetical protein